MKRTLALTFAALLVVVGVQQLMLQAAHRRAEEWKRKSEREAAARERLGDSLDAWVAMSRDRAIIIERTGPESTDVRYRETYVPPEGSVVISVERLTALQTLLHRYRFLVDSVRSTGGTMSDSVRAELARRTWELLSQMSSAGSAIGYYVRTAGFCLSPLFGISTNYAFAIDLKFYYNARFGLSGGVDFAFPDGQFTLKDVTVGLNYILPVTRNTLVLIGYGFRSRTPVAKLLWYF